MTRVAADPDKTFRERAPSSATSEHTRGYVVCGAQREAVTDSTTHPPPAGDGTQS